MDFINSFFNELIKDPYFQNFVIENTKSNFLKFEKYYRNTDILLNEECYLSSGMTKGCFIFPKRKLVLKIPFDNENYCELEEVNYKKARTCGLEHFFAESWKETDIIMSDSCDDIRLPVYGMTFAETIEEDDFVEYSYRSGYNKYGLGEGEVGLLFGFFGECYSLEEIEELMVFMKDNEINDIHPGNLGYINGNPVFIDYSGFLGVMW